MQCLPKISGNYPRVAAPCKDTGAAVPTMAPTQNHNSSIGAGWDTSSLGGQGASRANTEAHAAFSRVPLPMAEAGVKTHKEGWDIDLCATDGCGSAQGQHGQELMPQPQVPHSHGGDTRTGHTLPHLHQAPASTAMLRAQPQHQGPQRQHHQASPVRSPNISIDKTLALAAQTTNHKNILHDAQPGTAEQLRFSESTGRSPSSASLTWDDRNGVFLPGHNTNVFLH